MFYVYGLQRIVWGGRLCCAFVFTSCWLCVDEGGGAACFLFCKKLQHASGSVFCVVGKEHVCCGTRGWLVHAGDRCVFVVNIWVVLLGYHSIFPCALPHVEAVQSGEQVL